jgi:hypothetical protein
MNHVAAEKSKRDYASKTLLTMCLEKKTAPTLVPTVLK